MQHKHLSKINFHFPAKGTFLKDRRRLKKFILALFGNEGRHLESLNYIFCSDKYLLSINQSFLSHNYYTDIITFEFSETKKVVVGEIYISIDRVRFNSRLFSTTIKEELHRVIIHGALHLCGYKDKTKTECLIMKEKENFYLNKYFKN